MVAREIAEHVIRRATAGNHAAANIAKIIAGRGGLDIGACEAAGLAHDLGHPPFGHAGEDALDTRYRNDPIDGFEGNAQSFRIVTRLDLHKKGGKHGLDLTYVTLAAILKYPWTRQDPFEADENRKFGAYETEAEILGEVRARVAGSAGSKAQTLEASIMDLADDMAYAIHDLEDFFAAGLIRQRAVLEEMDSATAATEPGKRGFAEALAENPDAADAFTREAAKLGKKYNGYFSDALFYKAIEDVRLDIDELYDAESIESYEQLKLKLSGYVDKFFAQIKISGKPAWSDGPLIYLDKPAWHLMQCLKVITRQFVVSTSAVGMLQRAQREAIVTVVSKMEAWLRDQPRDVELPLSLRRVMGAAGVEYARSEMRQTDHRAICDYICGMSDSEALMRARWLGGMDSPGMSSLGAHLS